jgi:hypothetical protein
MKKKVDMYVCSKPLQYFNVLNLPRNKSQKNILVIEDKFKDAHAFYESIKMYDKSWSEIHYTHNRAAVFFLCFFKYRVINFYYYLDFLLKASLFLYALPCKNIFIYEEGISAYRTDIFKNTARYKRVLRKLLGMSEYAGHHPRVRGIYVYNKEKYFKIFSAFKHPKKPNPVSFNTSFDQMLEDNLELALQVFQFDANILFEHVKNKSALLYITSWPLEENFIKNVNMNEYDYCIIKPHPHIRELNYPAWWKNDKTLIIDSPILAEFIIKILLHRNNRLDIYHHNSSAAMYINKHPNIGSVKSI